MKETFEINLDYYFFYAEDRVIFRNFIKNYTLYIVIFYLLLDNFFKDSKNQGARERFQ